MPVPCKAPRMVCRGVLIRSLAIIFEALCADYLQVSQSFAVRMHEVPLA